ncbi:MAG: hypothetical protein IE918_00685 [Campylobacterales bacterium]|nr:hypothetical protein [Campylobacterales bacterium]
MYKRVLIATALASTLLTGSAIASQHGMKDSSTPHMHQKKSDHDKQKKHFVKKVIDAVSKTGIDATQAQKVTDAINTFKQAKMKIKQQGPVCPLDAFKGNTFDRQVFKEVLLSKPEAKINARADLLEAIFGILNEEQRKIFTREFKAHMIEKTIKKNMIKGHMMSKGAMKGKQQ